MEEQAIYDQIDFNVAYEEAVHMEVRRHLVSGVICPNTEPTSDWWFGPGGRSDWHYAKDNTIDKPAHYYGVIGAKGTNEYSAASAPNNQYPFSKPGWRTDYGGWATNGLVLRDETVPARRAPDGLSKTFMFGEVAWDDNSYESWMGGVTEFLASSINSLNIRFPLNSVRYGDPVVGNNFNDRSFASEHPGRGVHFAMGDGSSHYISEDIELRLLKALASRDQAEVFSADEL